MRRTGCSCQPTCTKMISQIIRLMYLVYKKPENDATEIFQKI